jgi:quercetin dioxygenase-like cupin family protein/DNA-binding Xre family transcriptional regulator
MSDAKASGAVAPLASVRTMSQMGETHGFGGALRSLRRERRLSLQEVSAATGISASFLSLVENDKSDITLGRLITLSQFYDVHISDLIPHTSRDPVVIRANEQQHLASRSEGIDIYLLGPDGLPRRMLPLIAVFAPGGQLAEWSEHEGEEYIYVLEGCIRLELEGHEPVVLEAGDGAYYRADRPHSFATVGDEPARVFGVVSPPHM